MSKKILVLALAVVSSAFWAMSAIAAAQEIHLEPAEAFTVASAGGEVRAEGEPTVTCTALGGSGSFDVGSTTTGTITRDYTGCHTSVFGFTATCKSEGAATAGTVANSGTFHLITISPGVPGILMTTNPTKLVCAGISTITFTGNMIGTIVSPKCGENSKVLTVSLTATGNTQNHQSYTGGKYDLVAQTNDGVNKTAAMIGSATNTQTNAAKLNCT
jgi:hypothetical protein